MVIGVHIPESIDDDPPLSDVLSNLRGKRVLYIAGPGAAAEASAATELGFEAHQLGFAEAVGEGGVIESFLAG